MRRQRNLLGAEIVRQVHLRFAGQLPQPPQQFPAVLVRHFHLGGLPQGLDHPRRSAVLQRCKAICPEHEALLEDCPRPLHGHDFVARRAMKLAAEDPALPRRVGLDVETELPGRPVIPGQRPEVIERRLAIDAVLRPHQPLRGSEFRQEELLHVLGQHGLRNARRRVTVVRPLTFHVVIAEQEMEDLGVLGTQKPVHFVRPHAQLFQLAELAVGLDLALKEAQDRLAAAAAYHLVEHVPDFASLRQRSHDGSDGRFRLDIRRGPGELLLPAGLGRRCLTARFLLRRTAADGLAARRRIIVGPQTVVVVILVVFRNHRQEIEPALAAGADSCRICGQDGGPDMLAGLVGLIVGASAADGQLLAAESPVQNHLVLVLAVDEGPKLVCPPRANRHPVFLKVFQPAAADCAIELVDATIGQRHAQLPNQVFRLRNADYIAPATERRMIISASSGRKPPFAARLQILMVRD